MKPANHRYESLFTLICKDQEAQLVTGIIDRIVERRVELGLTQREVAQLAGIQQSYLARIENGCIIPQISTLAKIVIALGLTIQIVSNTLN